MRASSPRGPSSLPFSETAPRQARVRRLEESMAVVPFAFKRVGIEEARALWTGGRRVPHHQHPVLAVALHREQLFAAELEVAGGAVQ